MMGHPTYGELLEKLIYARDVTYSSDPEWKDARLDAVERILQATLEKLRDEFDK